MSEDRRSGFTVLEMLVAIMVVALTTTVLVDGLARFFDLRRRVAERLVETERQILVGDWFRRSIAALAPLRASPAAPSDADISDAGPSTVVSSAVALSGAPPAEAPPFIGDADGFSASTLAPLGGPAGIPTAMRWELVTTDDGRRRLRYRDERGRDFLLAVVDDGRFAFFDAAGGRHDGWPPSDATVPALPRLVLFQGRRAEGDWLLAAHPRAAVPASRPDTAANP